IGLLVAASPLLHAGAIGSAKSGCVHTVIAVLVDDVVPGAGIDAGVGPVDANIVDKHRRRIGRRSVGESREASAADREIHQDEERRVENPLAVDPWCRGSNGEKGMGEVIPVKLHLVLRPDDAVDVIAGIIDSGAVWERECSPNAAASGISGPVNGG